MTIIFAVLVENPNELWLDDSLRTLESSTSCFHLPETPKDQHQFSKLIL